MKNPFSRNSPLSGPYRDMIPVSPSDTADIHPDGTIAPALHVQTGGTLRFISAAGEVRTRVVPDFAEIPVGAIRVLQTGTTATGIHAYVV